jgi:hypothetical protein
MNSAASYRQLEAVARQRMVHPAFPGKVILSMTLIALPILLGSSYPD